ncbi:MAG TPA: BTAD domain-containing putative transcriptional regulator [Gemmatimonadales bacterium]|nr:BTAD domain-containing putative transcriptional regulator [Gemmatimonadales bacterium]
MHAGKPLALLAYLALAPGRRESRDRITRLFWPGARDTKANAALREARHRLHDAVGVPLIRPDTRGQLLLCDGVALDCIEGVRAFENGDIMRARTLLGGRFLGSFELEDSQEFSEWRDSQDTRLRKYHAAASRELANRAIAQGDLTQALELAQELFSDNPMLEDNVRLLMTVLEASGNHTGALARYSEYAALLKRALEDSPSPELQQHAADLERRVNTRLAPPSAPANPPPTAPRIPREPRGPWPAWSSKLGRREWVTWSSAVLALTALGLVIGVQAGSTRTRPSLGPLPGTLYVAHEGSPVPGPGPVPAVMKVNWPRRPGDSPTTRQFQGWPGDLPPQLLPLLVTGGSGSHTKIFLIRDRDTTQLTDGPTDDGPAVWSPDRRWIAVQRGWRVGDDYRFNLFVLDSTGTVLRQLTNGPQQDFLLAWSPDGSRLAIQRAVNGDYTLWTVDSDGGHPENLSQRFSLRDPVKAVAFAPDGGSLAVTTVSVSTVELLGLMPFRRRSLAAGCEIDPNFIAWSPDGRWLALACQEGTNRFLTLLAANGSARHDRVADLGDHKWYALAWVADSPRYVEHIEIRPRPISIPVGRGRRIQSRALDAKGEPMRVPLRWLVGDTTVASVDELGFLRGHRPGRTWLTASAGGFRADSTEVAVVPARIDTLLHETWAEAINAARWQVVGMPPPMIVSHAMPDGSPAFLSNGDFNWPSGVLSAEEFPTEDGVTLEVQARFAFTGDHWQEFEVALVPRSMAFHGSERAVSGRLAWWWISGPSPRYLTRQVACGSDQADGVVRGDSLPLEENRWHRLALQLRPDGILECYFDGRRIGSVETLPRLRASSLAIYLGGRTHRTQILHGPALLTRGLRY